MIIYNVTVKIDSDIEKDWLHWMQEEHIPDVLATGCFLGHEILRLRYPKDDEGSTFAIRYECADMAVLEKYHREHASRLQADHRDRYGHKAVAFRTILETLDNIV